eukprot:scaffold124921_cov59-Phaeocystis_antarctica.AAC.5
MRKNADFFGMYFEDGTEFTAYLRDMARSRTWGDELTLRAAVEAYGCSAHVLTTTPANWYLVPGLPARGRAPHQPAAAQGCRRAAARQGDLYLLHLAHPLQRRAGPVGVMTRQHEAPRVWHSAYGSLRPRQPYRGAHGCVRGDSQCCRLPVSCYFNKFFTRNQPHKHLYSLREISTPTHGSTCAPPTPHAVAHATRHRWLSGWAHCSLGRRPDAGDRGHEHRDEPCQRKEGRSAQLRAQRSDQRGTERQRARAAESARRRQEGARRVARVAAAAAHLRRRRSCSPPRGPPRSPHPGRRRPRSSFSSPTVRGRERA